MLSGSIVLWVALEDTAPWHFCCSSWTRGTNSGPRNPLKVDLDQVSLHIRSHKLLIDGVSDTALEDTGLSKGKSSI